MSSAAEEVVTIVHDEGAFLMSGNLHDFLAEQVVAGRDISDITERANRHFDNGALPGVQDPVIDRAGHVIDPNHRRRYLQPEIEALVKSDGVNEAIDRLLAEREEYEAEIRRDKRSEQLATARAVKAARGERDLVPLLFEHVRELTVVVEVLLDRVDRGLVEVPKLPEWAD